MTSNSNSSTDSKNTSNTAEHKSDSSKEHKSHSVEHKSDSHKETKSHSTGKSERHTRGGRSTTNEGRSRYGSSSAGSHQRSGSDRDRPRVSARRSALVRKIDSLETDLKDAKDDAVSTVKRGADKLRDRSRKFTRETARQMPDGFKSKARRLQKPRRHSDHKSVLETNLEALKDLDVKELYKDIKKTYNQASKTISKKVSANWPKKLINKLSKNISIDTPKELLDKASKTFWKSVKYASSFGQDDSRGNRNRRSDNSSTHRGTRSRGFNLGSAAESVRDWVSDHIVHLKDRPRRTPSRYSRDGAMSNLRERMPRSGKAFVRNAKEKMDDVVEVSSGLRPNHTRTHATRSTRSGPARSTGRDRHPARSYGDKNESRGSKFGRPTKAAHTRRDSNSTEGSRDNKRPRTRSNKEQ